MTMATAGLALVCWTMVMWFWMFALRMKEYPKAKVDFEKDRRAQDAAKYKDALPERVYWVGDNYAHLHEQPVLFYFLVLYSQAYGVADDLNVMLAWGYVIVRVIHSIWQGTVNAVMPRFGIFVIGSVLLMVILARNVIAAMV